MRSFCLVALLGLAAFVASPRVALAQDLPLSQLLIPGEGWKLIAEGFSFTEGPAVDEAGNLFFVDVPTSKILKHDVTSGKTDVFVAESGKASGLMFGGDGRLYAAQSGERAIVAYDRQGAAQPVASDIDVNDLVVTRDNLIFVTDPKNKQVWRIDAQGAKKVVDSGIERPNGIILWPDQRTLLVADSAGTHLWTFRLTADGLNAKQPYYTMQLTSGMILQDKSTTGADGMTVDTVGRVYVCTHAGLQVFDTQGRLAGVIAKPQEKFLSNVVFAGVNLDTLYVTCTDKVYSRKVKAAGVRNFGEAK